MYIELFLRVGGILLAGVFDGAFGYSDQCGRNRADGASGADLRGTGGRGDDGPASGTGVAASAAGDAAATGGGDDGVRKFAVVSAETALHAAVVHVLVAAGA